MTDLDSLPMHDGHESPATRNGATGRKRCRRHHWNATVIEVDGRLANGGWVCFYCGARRDPAASRRGRSADRLGKDQERRIERVYGPRKRGQYGDAVDHLGVTFKWQAKSTRGPVPLWLADLSEHSRIPVSITSAMSRMADVFTDHLPLVIRSYVRHGVPTRDYVFVRFRDWWQLHGPMAGNRDIRVIAAAETGAAFVVMTGATFLDLHGPDAA
jgi:hypothetical protein